MQKIEDIDYFNYTAIHNSNNFILFTFLFQLDQTAIMKEKPTSWMYQKPVTNQLVECKSVLVSYERLKECPPDPNATNFLVKLSLHALVYNWSNKMYCRFVCDY